VPFRVSPERAAASLSVAAPPLGFRALQRLRTGEPTDNRVSHTRFVAPSGSSALLTLCFSPELHGLVSCRARSWASPFGAFPFAEREPASRRILAHLTFTRTARGLAPRSSCGFWALTPSGSPLHARGVIPTNVPLLPWASPLQGSLPAAMAAGFPATSSHELTSGFAARRCSSECRSRRGWFVSVETTAPPGVLAPRSSSR
jgi:hypothetical protein